MAVEKVVVRDDTEVSQAEQVNHPEVEHKSDV